MKKKAKKSLKDFQATKMTLSTKMKVKGGFIIIQDDVLMKK